jgi:pimeloyl-ACP methyl ester carboxylesterase
MAKFRAILLALALSGVTQAQEAPGAGIEGYWVGKLKVLNQELLLGFAISKTPEGGLKATVDSPDQGASDIPVEETTFKDGRLLVNMRGMQAVYSGDLAKDGLSIEGKFVQGGMTLPLVLKKGARSALRKRPQEPAKPYPYVEEEVAYSTIRIAGTLTLPKTQGPHPAVVLITGSGPQDRDEAIVGHRPFLVLADHLTRQGIAVLRCDDRGVAKSTGKFARATSEDFADDVLAGVDYLKTRPEINTRQIGLIGHSEGGLIAPLVAAQSKDVAFIVLLAGPGVPGDEILYSQVASLLKFQGKSPEAIAANRVIQQRTFGVLKEVADAKLAGQKIRAIVEEELAKLPESVRKEVGETNKIQDALPGPWFRYFINYDPRPTLRRVKCPVLALNGEMDYQVAPGENLPEIEKALKEGGNSDVTVRQLPKLNHLFQTCQTGSGDEYARIDETYSPVMLNLVSEWIRKRTIENR